MGSEVEGGAVEPSKSDGSATRSQFEDQQLRNPDRVIMLSDGVFAIVLTILVLEIKVPTDLASNSLRASFHELRPTLEAWIVSFLIAGMYWVAHRDIFARVRSVNRDLVWLNLLFLLPCALIPFGASALGEYPNESLALQLYGVVVIAASVMRVVLYWYVVRHPKLLWPQAITGRSTQGFILSSIPIVAYLIAMAVAYASPTASVILFLSVPVVYFLAVTIARERGGVHGEAEDFS
jgi:TMEM175 potassium channel family protein